MSAASAHDTRVASRKRERELHVHVDVIIVLQTAVLRAEKALQVHSNFRLLIVPRLAAACVKPAAVVTPHVWRRVQHRLVSNLQLGLLNHGTDTSSSYRLLYTYTATLRTCTFFKYDGLVLVVERWLRRDVIGALVGAQGVLPGSAVSSSSGSGVEAAGGRQVDAVCALL